LNTLFAGDPAHPQDTSNVLHDYDATHTYKMDAYGNKDSVHMHCQTNKFQLIGQTTQRNYGDELWNRCHWETHYDFTEEFVHDLSCESK